ncbi:uncharacterized protein MONOS_18334 [Monocercomonoides exilis]|uniref:uncharacterized protein n=1 Tax=Monocercomonoides exilis TaxID=2049356 RepID=UPI003559503F|nr:hypothetical protein MONOS_18334 [Monocercomonoides exilis]
MLIFLEIISIYNCFAEELTQGSSHRIPETSTPEIYKLKNQAEKVTHNIINFLKKKAANAKDVLELPTPLQSRQNFERNKESEILTKRKIQLANYHLELAEELLKDNWNNKILDDDSAEDIHSHAHNYENQETENEEENELSHRYPSQENSFQPMHH